MMVKRYCYICGEELLVSEKEVCGICENIIDKNGENYVRASVNKKNHKERQAPRSRRLEDE
jgi:hypothetical protein